MRGKAETEPRPQGCGRVGQYRIAMGSLAHPLLSTAPLRVRLCFERLLETDLLKGGGFRPAD